MAQNISVPAFGDNFLARQENHSHYLECARHLFSLGPGPSLLCLSLLNFHPHPSYHMIHQPQENYPGWKLAGAVWGWGQRKKHLARTRKLGCRREAPQWEGSIPAPAPCLLLGPHLDWASVTVRLQLDVGPESKKILCHQYALFLLISGLGSVIYKYI